MDQIHDLSKLSPFYQDWEESMIWSCFQRVMGEAYADNTENPQSAVVCVNCFAFAAGKPDELLIRDWYHEKAADFSIITARDDSWNEIFERVGKDKSRRVERYVIKKEEGIFDVAQLNTMVEQLSGQYELRPIDEPLYNRCKEHDWSADWVQGYETYDKYCKYGLGIVALYGEEIVAGASSYSSYLGGIEVQIDTKEEYRRRGLATACGAKLILECLKRGLYPSWDAQNKWSVSLAEKLGYHYSHAYTAYEVWK